MTSLSPDTADMSDAEREAQLVLLLSDVAPERARERQRQALDRLTAEQRHARYREMELRVVAQSKEELEITGVFGTKFVSVGAPSRSPRTLKPPT